MTDDLDNVFAPLTDEPAEELKQEPEPVVEEIAEASVEPEPIAVEPEPEVVAEPARPDPGFVPLSAMMDERDRRKAAEARAAELERQQQNSRPSIDPFDDPEGYAQQQQMMVANQVAEVRFQMSDMMARQTHGADAVDAAISWAGEKAKSDPVFAASYMRDSNPINWIVQQHKRHSLVDQIGDRSLDDFVKDHIAKNPSLLAGVAPVTAALAVAPQQASPSVKVPRSLATQGSGPSDVRDIAAGPLAGVDAVFT